MSPSGGLSTTKLVATNLQFIETFNVVGWLFLRLQRCHVFLAAQTQWVCARVFYFSVRKQIFCCLETSITIRRGVGCSKVTDWSSCGLWTKNGRRLFLCVGNEIFETLYTQRCHRHGTVAMVKFKGVHHTIRFCWQVMEGVEEEEGVYLLGGAAGRNASNTKLFQKTGEEKKK